MGSHFRVLLYYSPPCRKRYAYQPAEGLRSALRLGSNVACCCFSSVGDLHSNLLRFQMTGDSCNNGIQQFPSQSSKCVAHCKTANTAEDLPMEQDVRL